jgi:ABC-2 type transport system permease protein
MPILLIGLNAFTTIQSNRIATDSVETEETSSETAISELPAIGLLDDTGLLNRVPPGYPERFVRYPDQATARAALEAGYIEQYVYIPADYVATGQVTVYDQDFQIVRGGDNLGVSLGSEGDWLLRYLIEYNLTGDSQLILTLRNPTPGTLAEYHALAPREQPQRDDEALAEVVSSVMPYIYYFLLIMGSNYLMRSVVAEKENRTAEVLLLSLHPRQLMVGKILAMSLVTLVQVVVWVGGGILILNRSADILQVASFSFPPGFVIWAILFLILGYLLYASVMAAAGAIAPTAREVGQVTLLLILPLMPTLMFGREFVAEPNGTLSLVLSLFPFSAPAAMVTRIAVAEVPLWQILLSLAGLAVTAYIFVTLAGRFFRAGNLLAYTPFSLRRLATGWRK